jgi:hypothetical protein
MSTIHSIQKKNYINVTDLQNNYSIYKAYDKDTTYTKGYQNREKHSLQLFKRNEPHFEMDDVKLYTDGMFNAPRKTISIEPGKHIMYEFIVLQLSTSEDVRDKYRDDENCRTVSLFVKMKFFLEFPPNVMPLLHISEN